MGKKVTEENAIRVTLPPLNLWNHMNYLWNHMNNEHAGVMQLL